MTSHSTLNAEKRVRHFQKGNWCASEVLRKSVLTRCSEEAALAVVGCSVDSRREAVENNLGQRVGSQTNKALYVKLSCLNFIFKVLEVWKCLIRKYEDENDFQEYEVGCHT